MRIQLIYMQSWPKWYIFCLEIYVYVSLSLHRNTDTTHEWGRGFCRIPEILQSQSFVKKNTQFTYNSLKNIIYHEF